MSPETIEQASHAIVGNRIWFHGQRQSYTIRAANKRFMVCTRPFNLRHTVLYTVVSLDDQIRGTENCVFGAGAETDEQCQEMLERLTSGKTGLSSRNRVPLAIANYSV